MDMLRVLGWVLLILVVLYVGACTIGAGFRHGFYGEARVVGSSIACRI
jgi:hypothetical protein